MIQPANPFAESGEYTTRGREPFGGQLNKSMLNFVVLDAMEAGLVIDSDDEVPWFAVASYGGVTTILTAAQSYDEAAAACEALLSVAREREVDVQAHAILRHAWSGI